MTPEEIRNFIYQHISSVEQLEILLLLRTHAEREWSAQSLSAELRSSPESVEQRLRNLYAQRFLWRSEAKPFTYRYAPMKPSLDFEVAGLAEAYRERRISVIQTIFSRSQADLDSLRSFSDAFKIKKDEDDSNDR